MTGLRIELRRSTALWAGLVVLVCTTGMLALITFGSSRWPANSTSAVLALHQPLAYVWALVVGLAVLQGMRDSRARVTELVATTSRPGWVRYGTLATVVAGAVAVAGAVLCAGVVIRVALGGGFVSVGFVPLTATVVLVLGSNVLVGLALGRLLPHPLAAPVALVVTFMLATVATQSFDDITSPQDEISPFALLTPVFSTPNSDLVTTSTSVDLGRLVWFTGLGLTGFGLFAARTLLGRLTALLPAALALALALAILPAKYSDVLVSDSIASKLVCQDDVCLSAVHAGVLPKVAAAGRDALAKLAALPGAPTRIHEDTSSMAHLTVPRRDPRVVYLTTSGFPGVLTLPEEQIRLELLAGAGVPACVGPNSLHVSATMVSYLTAGYLNGGLAPVPSGSYLWASERLRGELDQAWQQFRGQSPQEQLKRVAQARQMLLDCQDSDRVLDVLTARG